MKAFVFCLLLVACSSNPTPAEPKQGCEEGTCPLHQPPPSSSEATPACKQAIDNLVKFGLFETIGRQPPEDPYKQLFCNSLEGYGYNIDCLAKAKDVTDMYECGSL